MNWWRGAAILRRKQQFADPTLRFGEMEMNRMDRSVRRDGHHVELTAKEFALLEFMLQRRGQTCTRSELLREVWQSSPDAGTNIVDVYVNYLRKKLAAANPQGHSSIVVIETVRGAGYRLSHGRNPAAPVCALEAPRNVVAA